MTYFEELEKNTEIIKALAGEVIKSSADIETIMTTANIVSDTVYRLKIAKGAGVSSKESYSADCLVFTKIDIKTLKKFYSIAHFEQLTKNIEKSLQIGGKQNDTQ